MSLAEAAIHEALDGITVDGVRLHSGDPGAAGTSNALGAGISAATFNAAVGGERQLNADILVTGLAASQAVTHFSLWDSTTFKGSGSITSGDTAANSSGEFTLEATSTLITGV